MDQLYKSCRITTSPQLSQDADCWIPQAVVSWDEQGSSQRHLLTGPSDRFKLIDHAETYALEMAMAWIDNQSLEEEVRLDH